MIFDNPAQIIWQRAGQLNAGRPSTDYYIIKIRLPLVNQLPVQMSLEALYFGLNLML